MYVDRGESIECPLLIASTGKLTLHELLDKTRELLLHNAPAQVPHQQELKRKCIDTTQTLTHTHAVHTR